MVIHKTLIVVGLSSLVVLSSECVNRRYVDVSGLMRQENCVNDPGGQYNAIRMNYLKKLLDDCGLKNKSISAVRFSDKAMRRNLCAQGEDGDYKEVQENISVRVIDGPKKELVRKKCIQLCDEEKLECPAPIIIYKPSLCMRVMTGIVRVFHAMKKRDMRSELIVDSDNEE